MGISYPWPKLTEMLMGIRRKELVTITAGTGVGKSLIAGLIAHDLIVQGHKIGYISLEESSLPEPSRGSSGRVLAGLYTYRGTAYLLTNSQKHGGECLMEIWWSTTTSDPSMLSSYSAGSVTCELLRGSTMLSSIT